MLILRGKHKGSTARVHQFCNDWISADIEDGPHAIVSPTTVQLDADEIARFRASADVGVMWEEFDLSDDGRFRRKEKPEAFLVELAGGPLDGSHWIYNHDGDVPTADPSVTWIAQPEPRTWPLPETIPAGDSSGYYVKDSESAMPPQTSKRSHVVRGAFYVWREGGAS